MGIIRSYVSKIFGHHLTAVILAAGSGERMGTTTPKQFLFVDGKSVLLRSIEAFEASGYVNDIIIVTSKDYISTVEELVSSHGITKVFAVIEGGDTRFESAFKALEVVSEKATHIAIHDAARCLITTDMINDVIACAFKTGAAFAASKPTDTIKLMTKDGITETKDKQLSRNKLMAASTPQIFNINMYRAGAYTARKDKYQPTDDCSVVEYVGFSCHPVDVGYENIKITIPQDIVTAEFILKQRQEREAKIAEEKAAKKAKGGKKA
ncbi:MAG: 2-C-methyl-D-erythritol 4-phosphate cytidylyltransferase [Ruminococcaceae bacterium]|nr:2-C-methyl-D-erythritol 4-phosphate cytidylyltransferase [Oscillospiraceae bacterium]